MKDPSIPKSQKKPALESILQKLNCHEITQRFFGELSKIVPYLGLQQHAVQACS